MLAHVHAHSSYSVLCILLSTSSPIYIGRPTVPHGFTQQLVRGCALQVRSLGDKQRIAGAQLEAGVSTHGYQHHHLTPNASPSNDTLLISSSVHSNEPSSKVGSHPKSRTTTHEQKEIQRQKQSTSSLIIDSITWRPRMLILYGNRQELASRSAVNSIRK